MTRPTDFEFANNLTFGQANDLVKAIDAALDAMAHHGPDDDHMMTLSALRVIATNERATAFRRESSK